MPCRQRINYNSLSPHILARNYLTCARNHSLHQRICFLPKQPLRAFLHTPYTILVKPNRRTRRVQPPLNRTSSPRRSPLIPTPNVLAPRNLLKIRFEIFLHPHQALILAGADIQAEAHGAWNGIRAAGAQGEDSRAREAGVCRCCAVGMEDHFGGGEHGVRAIGEVSGTGVAITAFDGYGMPAVGLYLFG